MRRSKTVLLMIVALAGAGTLMWAGFFLQGARNAEEYPSDVLVKYSVPPCVLISDGSDAGAPDSEYWLIEDEGRVALFQRDASGTGVIIENHWLENDGDHFFVWVQDSHAWEYVVPRDRSGDAVRLVYLGGTYSLERDEQWVTKPVGDPTVKCVLKAGVASVIADRVKSADVMDEPAVEGRLDTDATDQGARHSAGTPSGDAGRVVSDRPSQICLRFKAVGRRRARDLDWVCSDDYSESPSLWIGDDSGYRHQQLQIRTSGPDSVCLRHSCVGGRGVRESDWLCSQDGQESDWLWIGDDSGYRQQKLQVVTGGSDALCIRYSRVGRRGSEDSDWACSRDGEESPWVMLGNDSGYQNQRLGIKLTK